MPLKWEGVSRETYGTKSLLLLLLLLLLPLMHILGPLLFCAKLFAGKKSLPCFLHVLEFSFLYIYIICTAVDPTFLEIRFVSF